MPYYIVLGYNDYDIRSHQWRITDDLKEAREVAVKWEKLHLVCQIREIGDTVDNPLSHPTGRVDIE